MIEQLQAAPPPRKSFVPVLRSPWWTAVLVFSLMANLLVGGAVLGARFKADRWQRVLADTHAQLLPRKFFADLSHDRRKELIGIFRAKRDEFKQTRAAVDATALKLADTLEQSNFDLAAAKSAVTEFANDNATLVGRSDDLVMDFLGKLSPDERKALASSIRSRAALQSKN